MGSLQWEHCDGNTGVGPLRWGPCIGNTAVWSLWFYPRETMQRYTYRCSRLARCSRSASGSSWSLKKQYEIRNKSTRHCTQIQAKNTHDPYSGSWSSYFPRRTSSTLKTENKIILPLITKEGSKGTEKTLLFALVSKWVLLHNQWNENEVCIFMKIKIIVIISVWHQHLC